MKSKNIILTAMLTVLPSALMAQQHIEKAFEALRVSDCQEETMSRHQVDKAQETGVMEGMSDEYEFKMTKVNAASKQLITDIRNAFTKDREAAYKVSSGTHGGAENYTSLAVGNSNGGGIAIGLMNDSKWMYACYLDPADKEKTHRYAYGFEWVEQKDGTIIGRMVKTYATTQKYRMGRNKKISSRISINGKDINVDGQSFAFSGFPFDGSSVFDSDSLFFNRQRSSESWLSEFNTYKNHFLKKPDGNASSHYATSIYKLCKNAKSLDDVEKKMVATEIQKLKKKTNDEFIQQLFDMSIERLKK